MQETKVLAPSGNGNGSDLMPLARLHDEYVRLAAECRDIGAERQRALTAWAKLRDELDRQQENESSSLLHSYHRSVVVLREMDDRLEAAQAYLREFGRQATIEQNQWSATHSPRS